MRNNKIILYLTYILFEYFVYKNIIFWLYIVDGSLMMSLGFIIKKYMIKPLNVITF